MHYTLLFAARDKKAPIQLKIMSASSDYEKDCVVENMKTDWELIRCESTGLGKSLTRSEAE